MHFAMADVGEWWDNNGSEDFRIVLGPAPAGRGTAGAGPLAVAITAETCFFSARFTVGIHDVMTLFSE